jgi:hypothetical protein
MSEPKVLTIRRVPGVAGEYGYAVAIQYPDEPVERVMFKGSIYGPPIVMVTDGLPDGVFVAERVLSRCGYRLTPDWIRKFFAPKEAHE